MIRQLARPEAPSKTEFVALDRQGWALAVVDRIYDSSRSYRRDRCAIFLDPDSTYDFLHDSGLQADVLSPDENWHWTGTRRRKKLKSTLVADYEEWFRWFMKWQRFNAFQIIVLVAPIGWVLDDDRRGYIDGFLARLLKRPNIHKVIVVEAEHFQPLIKTWLGGETRAVDLPELKGKFGARQVTEAIVSILFGTHLSKQGLRLAAGSTLFSKLNPTWEQHLEDIMRRPTLVHRMSRWLFTAGYYGIEMVEAMETQEKRSSRENSDEPPKPIFKQAKNRGPSELSEDWLEGLTRSLLDLQGSFTIPSLYDHVHAETQKVLQTSHSTPRIFNDHFDYELPSEFHVFLPSRPLLRGIAERLASEGKLRKTTWVKEIGRPATVYYLPDKPPFLQASRCGQCAFYVPLRRQCRIWWLLNKSYTAWNDRWKRDGAHPLSEFELHKMRNSWRIGPHSSACTSFVEKKRDYTRKAFPELCDICYHELPAVPPKTSIVVCSNCRTRYFALKQKKVKVLTSYEHEFKKRYEELAGVDPSHDLKRLIEERQGSAPSIMERAIYDEHRNPGSDEDSEHVPKTVMIFPGDRMLAREGRLFIFKRRSVESLPLEGSTLIDLSGVVGEEQKDVLASAGMTVGAPPKTTVSSQDNPVSERFDIAPFVEETVRSNPEFVRRMALAMAQSAIHATEHASSVAKLQENHVQAFTARQKISARRLERVPPEQLSCVRSHHHEGVLELLSHGARHGASEIGPAKEGALREGVRHEPGRKS